MSEKQLNAKVDWLQRRLMNFAEREETLLARKVIPQAVFFPDTPRYSARPRILVFLPGVKSRTEVLESWVLQRLKRLGGTPDTHDDWLTVFQKPNEPTWEVKLFPRTWGA